MIKNCISTFQKTIKSNKLLIILVLAFILRIVNFNQSFWLDEAAQVIESTRPFNQQFHLSSDFQPPLYHLILHFWLYFGRSEIWVRFLSVIFGLLSIYILYLCGEQLSGNRQGILAALFLTLSPYHLWYSQEARPYMLFVFLSLLATYYLLRRKWIAYTLVIFLTLYSLYFAPFLLLGHFFYILLTDKPKIRLFFGGQVIAFLLFIPWLPSFFRQLQVGASGSLVGWSQVVSVNPLKTIPLTLAKFIFGKGTIDNLFLYGLIIFPVFFIFLYSTVLLLNKQKERPVIYFFLTSFTSAVLFSIFLPVIAPQRLIFLLPFFLLIMALAIKYFPKTWQIVAILIILLTNIAGILQYYLNPYVQREQWRQSVNFVELKNTGREIVLFAFPEPFAPFLWYSKNTVQAMGIAPDFKVTYAGLESVGQKLREKNRVYFYQYLSELTDPNHLISNFLQKEHFQETATYDFPGVGFVYIYDKK